MADEDILLEPFCLHFDGVATRGGEVPSGALIQALGGLQRSVFLTAMLVQGMEVNQRARVSRDTERRFGLICGTAQPGSYIQSYRIGDPRYTLFDRDLIQTVTSTHEEILRSVDHGDDTALRHVIKDGFYRGAILSSLRQMQPPKRNGIVVHVDHGAHGRLLNGRTAAANIELLFSKRQEPLVSPGVVTGTLIEMRFQERQIRIQTVPSGRAMTAAYADNFEPILLENPRQLVQIRGSIIFDEDGVTPLSVINVEEILEIDVSAIVVEHITIDNNLLRAVKPIVFLVSFSREFGSYEVTGPFDLISGAPTRSQLEDAVDDDLRFLWREYAQAADADLTESACRLKADLLSAFSNDIGSSFEKA